MNSKILSTCQARSSIVGAKGFFYPSNESSGLFIKKGTVVEVLNYLSGGSNESLQAISVPNHLIEGSLLEDGNGVYWVDRKNVG